MRSFSPLAAGRAIYKDSDRRISAACEKRMHRDALTWLCKGGRGGYSELLEHGQGQDGNPT